VQIGCSLGYEVDKPTLIQLLLQPLLATGQALLDERIDIESGAGIERATDPYGNPVLRTILVPGPNRIRYSAMLSVPHRYDNDGLPKGTPSAAPPLDVLRYTLPSRYCESDKLVPFASGLFGHLPRGLEAASAICEWTHRHIEYRYGSGDPQLSAYEAIRRGYGVCRDFAHVMVALCRALDMPARYAAGHIPLFDSTRPDPDSDIGSDFHAYAEVWIDGVWHVFDPRYNKFFIGRIKVAHGMDAVDAAFATIHGQATPLHFQAWASQVDPATADGGAPAGFSMPAQAAAHPAV
jgi:transglutaminase-like putative cysteine protease